MQLLTTTHKHTHTQTHTHATYTDSIKFSIVIWALLHSKAGKVIKINSNKLACFAFYRINSVWVWVCSKREGERVRDTFRVPKTLSANTNTNTLILHIHMHVLTSTYVFVNMYIIVYMHIDSHVDLCEHFINFVEIAYSHSNSLQFGICTSISYISGKSRQSF